MLYNNIMRIEALNTTLAGNICPIITISTDLKFILTREEELEYLYRGNAGKVWLFNRRKRRCSEFNIKEYEDDTSKDKKVIFICARVHPGEIQASYVMQGFIDWALSDSKEAIFLRKNCIIKIVPMLNPDGVVYGNTRTSLYGVDLNRYWHEPSEALHPSI